MRQLHVVGKHEKFVASGLYRVYAGETPTGLEEHWSVHETGGGAQFIRVDVDGRNFDGTSCLMEALLTPDNRFERIDLHFYEHSQPLKSSYVLFDDHIDILYTAEGTLNEQSVTLPAGYSVFTRSRIINGFALAAQQEGEATFFMPSAGSGYTVTAVTLTRLGEKMATVAGHNSIPVQGYRGPNETVFWLDGYRVLVFEESVAGKALLTRYARRPEPKHHV